MHNYSNHLSASNLAPLISLSMAKSKQIFDHPEKNKDYNSCLNDDFLALFFRNDWLRCLILHAAIAVVRHFIHN